MTRAIAADKRQAVGGARRKARMAALICLPALVVLSALVGLMCGASWVSPSSLLAALTGAAGHQLDATIIVDLRGPRVVLSGVTGGCLALAGALFQALFRNPLADPYLIGASSGASLGAVAAIVLGLGYDFLGLGAVPLLAFAGALGAVVLVFLIARQHGRLSVLTLILAGVAVSAFLSALVSLLTYLAADERLHQIIFWLLGGFGSATWANVYVALPYFVFGLALSLFLSRDLNALLLGEEFAHHLGVDVESRKRLVLLTASILSGVAVASGGVIGFVGLVVPHMVRLVGGPDHRFVLPASALGGAAVLMLADAVARSVLAPTELPVGIVTAMIGAPFFVFLLRSRKRVRSFGEVV